MIEMVLYLVFVVLTVGGILLMDRIYRLKRKNRIDRNKFFSVFDKMLVSISIVAILISMLWDFNFLRFATAIEHKNWQEITLADFKGLKRPIQTLEGNTEFAFISSTIDVAKKGETVKVRALFHPCRSYVFDRYIYAPGLLEHELTHFHITEYHARLLRKNISNGHLNLAIAEERIIEQENEMQKSYDYDTYHGQLNGKQIEWQNRLDSLLKGLKDFEPISVNSPEN